MNSHNIRSCTCQECIKERSDWTNLDGDKTNNTVRVESQQPGQPFPRSPLGATDALGHDRDEAERARAATSTVERTASSVVNDSVQGSPSPQRCRIASCGAIHGYWSPVHFTKPLDAVPCAGSWPETKKAKVTK